MALDPAPRRELRWSHKEKSVARAAFDSALARENASIRREVERILQSSNESGLSPEKLELIRRTAETARELDA